MSHYCSGKVRGPGKHYVEGRGGAPLVLATRFDGRRQASVMTLAFFAFLCRCPSRIAPQFIAIQVVGLNKGLVFGVGCSIVFLVLNYASERR